MKMAKNSLQAVVDEVYQNVVLRPLHLTGFKLITDKMTNGSALLFLKQIRGDVAIYNESISNEVFTPELIHKDDFKLVQLTMEELDLDECMYVIHSIDKEEYTFQFVILIDRQYLEWIREDDHNQIPQIRTQSNHTEIDQDDDQG